MIVRTHAALVGTLLAACACLLSAEHAVAKTQVAYSGAEITVVGGPEDNHYLIFESDIKLDGPGPTNDTFVPNLPLSQYLLYAPVIKPQVEEMLVQVNEIIATAYEKSVIKTATATQSSLALFGALVAAIPVIVVPPYSDEVDLERVVYVHDSSGAGFEEPIFPCRRTRWAGATVDPNTVECATRIDELPDLKVYAGPGDDHVRLAMHRTDTTSQRTVLGGKGRDVLDGSELDDILFGNENVDTLNGHDGVDWLHSAADNESDFLDCGSPGPAASASDPNQGDLADPGFEDFAHMQDCEDIAFPPLPEKFR